MSYSRSSAALLQQGTTSLFATVLLLDMSKLHVSLPYCSVCLLFSPLSFCLLLHSCILSFYFVHYALSYNCAMREWQVGTSFHHRKLLLYHVPYSKKPGQGSGSLMLKTQEAAWAIPQSGCEHDQSLHFFRQINITRKHAVQLSRAFSIVFSAFFL